MSADRRGNHQLGTSWHVEKTDGEHYFALEMGDKDFGRAYSERIPIARAILTKLGVLQ